MLAADSTLYPVAIARFAETAEWLEAPEAGATDYLEMPCELRQVRSPIVTATSRRANAAVNGR